MNKKIIGTLAGVAALSIAMAGCKSSPYQYTTAPAPGVSGWDYTPQAGTLCATVNVLANSYVYGQMSNSNAPDGHYYYANNVVSFAYNVWDTISQNNTYGSVQDAGTGITVPFGQLYPFYVYYNASYPYTLVNPTFYGPLSYLTTYLSANGSYLNSATVIDQVSDTTGNGEGQCGFAYTYTLSTNGPATVLDGSLRMSGPQDPKTILQNATANLTQWEQIKQLTTTSADTKVKMSKFDVKSAIIGNPKFKYGSAAVTQDQFNRLPEARKFVYLQASNELKLLSVAIAESVKKTYTDIATDPSIIAKSAELMSQGLPKSDSIARATLLVSLDRQGSVLANSAAFQASLNEISANIKAARK